LIRRDLWLRPAPADVLELWPQARQVAAVHTVYTPRRKGQKVRNPEWHYYLVVGPKRATPLENSRAAELIRGHWGIENRLHHVLDRTFGEDARRSALGAAPMALGLAARAAVAILRNLQLPGRKAPCMPEKRIHIAAKPERIASLIGAKG
jgi:hypothetical protein